MKTEELFEKKDSITGKGIREGFVYDDTYIEDEEEFVKILREAIPSFNADINAGLSDGYEGADALAGGLIPITISDDDLLKYSYDNEYHYWSEWDDMDVYEGAEAYDEDGNLYTSTQGQWILFIDLDDYELIGGDGIEVEVWQHEVTKKTINVPIEIVRDLKDVTFNE